MAFGRHRRSAEAGMAGQTASDPMYVCAGVWNVLSGMRRHQGCQGSFGGETADLVFLSSSCPLRGGTLPLLHADQWAFPDRSKRGQADEIPQRLSLGRAGTDCSEFCGKECFIVWIWNFDEVKKGCEMEKHFTPFLLVLGCRIFDSSNVHILRGLAVEK